MSRAAWPAFEALHAAPAYTYAREVPADDNEGAGKGRGRHMLHSETGKQAFDTAAEAVGGRLSDLAAAIPNNNTPERN